MRIPLYNRLKKGAHKEIAMLQDEVVDIIYFLSPKAVLHGGTAIWRCYEGNRFSEDLDFYLSTSNGFKQSFAEQLKSKGLILIKYKETGNTIFSKVSNINSEIRFEASLRKIKKYEVKPYEKTNGTYIDVLTLSPEDLLLEKANAYANRKLIRDFYDVYWLSRYLPENITVNEELGKFLKKAGKPQDEKTLKALVYSGAIPSFYQMLVSLKGRFRQ
ncbi:MAG: nucleotidyl transferase AbiEii/AbiGii toxin family protein [Candidatus Diapherotrites archaeon]